MGALLMPRNGAWWLGEWAHDLIGNPGRVITLSGMLEGLGTCALVPATRRPP